ncbi:uncharacterized protein LOC122849466 [Aphidius gifuensis]|uniref:uncharacterized protein LOC122849466 n=1 Tax=Aphidius gifuensis TaxID=684658 RepID=UPI001CDC1B99|nr:uncharacterized protein LOC122849466 [Aphidius gifuensis]
MDSPTISTTAPNIPNKLSDDYGTLDSSDVNQNQIDQKTHLIAESYVLESEDDKNGLETQLVKKENYEIPFDAKTLLDNKLSASLFENNGLDNKLLQLNDTLNKINQNKDQTLANFSEIKKYTKSLETSINDHQQEVKILQKIIFNISQKDLVESADLLETLISIMKFNEDNVPDDLLEKRRRLFEHNYDENETVVVNYLRKQFDDIALSSDSKYCNKYFCNKKISYYDSNICALLSEDPDNYRIDLTRRNLVYLPKDIFTGLKNLKDLKLSINRIYYLESSTFNNLSNLQRLNISNNNLTKLPSDIFNGLKKLEVLNLSVNKLNYLQPDTFDDLSNLQKLNLSYNCLTTFSSDILNGLEKLIFLDLTSNKLNSIQPGTFNNLSNLKYFLINDNHLTSLPKNIFTGLENLQVLGLSNNRLNYLDSDTFGNLPALKKLDIENNNLKKNSINMLKNSKSSSEMDIIYEKNNTRVELHRIIDILKSEISLKSQQYSEMSLQLKNKIDENEKIIQESVAMKKDQAEKLKAIENEYQLILTNKQREVEILKEIIFENLDGIEALFKTLKVIFKFDEDNVPDDLIRKRQSLIQSPIYNENQMVVVDDLRKRFDDIALTSNSQFSNRYFCNKKMSYYDSTTCALLNENLNSYVIDLSAKCLGVFPKDIFTGFENVGELYLSWNRLYYLESGTFNNLLNLKSLSIRNNHLTSLPKDIFTGLKNLENLDLSDNRLNYIESGTFSNLSNLQKLDISHNNLTALSSDIFNGLKNLTCLILTWNKLNSLQPGTFNGLSNLESLYICNNNLTALSSHTFNGLEQLRVLDLQSNKLNSLQPGTFDNLSTLQSLYIQNNSLKALSSGRFNSLEQLRVLELSWNNITSLQPGTFNNLSNLKELHIHHSNLTSLPTNIFTGLENLEWLSLSNNRLNHFDLDIFSNLPSSLQSLDLYDNNLTELPRDIFDGLEKLERLDISQNELYSLQPGTFYDLSNLWELLMERNNLRSLSENIFTGLKNLGKLNLLYNPLNYLDPEIFENLPKLFGLRILEQHLTTDTIYIKNVGSSEMDSPTTSTTAPNILNKSSDDYGTLDLSDVNQNQIDQKTHLTAESYVFKIENDKSDFKTQLADQQKEKENYEISFDAKTLFDNKLPASLLENNELNNELLQLNDTLKQTLAEYSEIIKKYTKSLETSFNDHQMSLKNQQYSNISLHLKNKIIESEKIIQESVAIKKDQAEKLKAIENEYRLNLMNKQQENEILKETIFEDLDGIADLLKTLTVIAKFDEDNVPDDLLEKRRKLFKLNYDENQTIVVDDLRKRFDNIALRSNSQTSNRYFCNKKMSYYDSTICEFLSQNLNNDVISLIEKNLSVIPKDIFTGFENVERLYLCWNRLYYLESGTFDNLLNLKILDIRFNHLTSLPKDIFIGLKNLEELDLSYNRLYYLESGTFSNFSNLKNLSISDNNLTALSSDIFNGLEKLKVLHLDYNKLNTLQRDLFSNLLNLQHLNIAYNNLTALSSDIFNSGLAQLRSQSISGSSEMDSPTTSTIVPNIPNKSSNDNDTVSSSNVNQRQIDLKTQLADQKEKKNYEISYDAKTLVDNKSSASPLENNELNKELLQLNDILKKINQDKKETLAEYSEINNKYKKSLETLFNDRQVNLEKNLKILELKKKDIIHDKNNTKVEMQRVIDSLQLEISLKTQQYSNISRQLQNKIEENNKMIQESIALKKEQAEKLKSMENEYHLNLTNKQQEVEILKEIVFENFEDDGVAELLDTLISIMEFNEHDVPNKLLEKRQRLFVNEYNENQKVVVDDLRKRFDNIALRSNSKFSNRYFCNKKMSYYDSIICAFVCEDWDNYEINLQFENLASIPEDIFTGCENVKKLLLSQNRLSYLESGTFNNLSNLKDLSIYQNHLLSLPKDIFTGLKNLTDLNLAYNRLDYLESGTFNNLSNLQVLYICFNNLTALSSDMFNGLEKLKVLYISSNKLNSLQPGTFKDLSNLQQLSIGHNNLTELSRDIFNGLEKLTWLNLSGNKLNSLQPGLFNNLSNLNYLLIIENHLTSLPKNIFTDLKNLRELLLSNNRLSYLDSDIFNNLPALNKLNIEENNLTTDTIYMLKNTYFFRNFELWL